MSSQLSNGGVIRRDEVYIGGKWVKSTASDTAAIISPFTEQPMGYAPDGTTEDIDHAVASARTAFDDGGWSRAPLSDRVEVLKRARELYAQRADELAALVTSEMGSTITFSTEHQAPIAQHIFSYFLNLAETFAFEERRVGLSTPALVSYEPVGVVAAIAAWNYPQALLLMKITPALLAGCTVVAKPSPETALDGLVLADIFAEAGVPPGVLNVVPGGREAGDHLISHRGVDKVSFTGSTAVGRRIAEVCGRDLRRYTLELGGKSAAIVLDDVDLPTTIQAFKRFSFANNGQTCTNQTRILVSQDRHDEFVDALCELVNSLSVGDPSDPATDIGPLVSERQRERVESYVRLAQEEGAKVATGGGRPPSLHRGWFVEPTVLTGATNQMRVSREEIFGPVVSVIPYTDEADAIRIANDSEYGLSGGVWGTDEAHALDVAKKISAGLLFVNGQGGSFDAPFGGFKQSGIGRECGREGLLSFLESKSLPLLPDG